MGTRREIILDEMERWKSEGLLDDAALDRLRARYDAAEHDARLDDALGQPARTNLGLRALQLVGGLLLGAACVALVVFLDLQKPAATAILAAFGVLGVAGGAAMLRMGPARAEGLGEASLAAGLVAMTIAPFFEPGSGDITSILALIVALGALFISRGASPITFLATASFAIAGGHSALGGFFSTGSTLRHVLWWLAMLGMGALLLRWRGHGWTSATLAGQVIPAVISFVVVLNDWHVEPSRMVEMILGAYLGAFLAIGIFLGDRGLVAGASLGLLVDAVAFAFDVGGTIAAFLLLAALGGLLVWQAEVLRTFFARRDRTRAR